MAAKTSKKSATATKIAAKKTSKKPAQASENESDAKAAPKSPAKSGKAATPTKKAATRTPPTAEESTAEKSTSKKEVKPAKAAKSASKTTIVAPPTAASPAAVVETDASGVSWIPADKDYALAMIDGKIVGRNPKGAKLSSVPPWLKESELAQQLSSLKDWLAEHEKQSLGAVELWMLRSLPVPRDVLAAIWPDPAWQSILMNAVVCSVKKGEISQTEAGFLRSIDERKGVGVVDLDGETQWLKVDAIAIPHPILLTEMNDFRQLSIELGIQQKLDQLFRQTWAPTKDQLKSSSINDFSGGKFEQLNHVLGLCRRLGYRVSGGYACSPVWENGVQVEARFWIGSDYPEGETWTADMIFTDSK